jgi:glutathione synthase/RimK-type ligase-like ATP-grasp enzyme
VQSKIEFARLVEEIGLPQPPWRLVAESERPDGLRFPYWLKTAFSTAGRGVRLVSDERSRTAATNEPLGATGGPLMAQGPAAGQYGQVQANDTTGQLRFPAGSDAVAQSQVR